MSGLFDLLRKQIKNWEFCCGKFPSNYHSSEKCFICHIRPSTFIIVYFTDTFHNNYGNYCQICFPERRNSFFDSSLDMKFKEIINSDPNTRISEQDCITHSIKDFGSYDEVMDGQAKKVLPSVVEAQVSPKNSTSAPEEENSAPEEDFTKENEDSESVKNYLWECQCYESTMFCTSGHLAAEIYLDAAYDRLKKAYENLSKEEKETYTLMDPPYVNHSEIQKKKKKYIPLKNLSKMEKQLPPTSDKEDLFRDNIDQQKPCILEMTTYPTPSDQPTNLFPEIIIPNPPQKRRLSIKVIKNGHPMEPNKPLFNHGITRCHVSYDPKTFILSFNEISSKEEEFINVLFATGSPSENCKRFNLSSFIIPIFNDGNHDTKTTSN
jgi:hypothetical protein